MHPEEVIFCKTIQGKQKIIRANTIKHYPSDTTACIFWLKNRKSENWRDRKEVEHSGEIGGTNIYNIINQVQRDFQENRVPSLALDSGDGVDKG